jgi:hypothetical protein
VDRGHQRKQIVCDLFLYISAYYNLIAISLLGIFPEIDGKKLKQKQSILFRCSEAQQILCVLIVETRIQVGYFLIMVFFFAIDVRQYINIGVLIC